MKLRRRIRLTAAVVFLALAFSASAAGTAEAGKAPDWWVNTNWLGNGASKNFTATSTEKTRISVPGLMKVTFESAKGKCGITGEIVGSPGETPGTKRKVLLLCSEMKVVGLSCVVHSVGYPPESVASEWLKSTLVWLNSTGEAAADRYSAEAVGGPLSELVLEGPLCGGASGKYQVLGEIIARITPIAEEANPATQSFPDPALLKWWNNAATREEKSITQMTVGGFNATLQSAFSVSLNPAEPFTIFGG